MLAGLGHRAVSGGTHQDRAVHLGSAGDHVLDVVGVARAVNVSVVTALGFVLDVRGVDGDAASLFFRRRVDLVVGLGLATKLARQHGRDRSRQRRLAVVNVTDRADVYVRLFPLEFFLSHIINPAKNQEIGTPTMICRTIKSMVPMGRIELPTSPLPRECSATELHGPHTLNLERVKGIEPSS